MPFGNFSGNTLISTLLQPVFSKALYISCLSVTFNIVNSSSTLLEAVIEQSSSSTVLSSSNLSTNGIYSNVSEYGSVNVLNNNIFSIEGLYEQISYINVVSSSIIYAESILGKEEHGNILVLSPSILVCDGIIPIRHNISCDIINIVNLNNITITSDGGVQSIINDDPIGIKNC